MVLYISPNGFLGGAERVVLLAAKGHLALGEFRPVILFFRDGEAVSMARALGIQCFVLKTSFSLSSLSLFKALRELRYVAKTFPIKIVHSTMPYAHLTAALALLNYPVKKVWFQHGPVGGTLDKLASLFAVDYLLFNSSYLQKLHHSSFPHNRIKYGEAIIPLAVETTHIAKNFSRQGLVFGSAGRITRGKGFEYIISSLSETNASFVLQIAGTPKSSDDEKYWDELHRLASSLPPHQKVVFQGHVREMDTFYREIDVFIHGSLTPEPFGLVIAEAMRAGCLVIAPAGGGSADYLTNGETGITFNDYHELKLILNDLIHRPRANLFDRMTEAGSELIRKKYSLPKMTEVLERIYREILLA